MGACVAVAAFTVEDVVLMSPLDYELDWWARVFQWVVSPILLTCGLFLYQVRSVNFLLYDSLANTFNSSFKLLLCWLPCNCVYIYCEMWPVYVQDYI